MILFSMDLLLPAPGSSSREVHGKCHWLLRMPVIIIRSFHIRTEWPALPIFPSTWRALPGGSTLLFFLSYHRFPLPSHDLTSIEISQQNRVKQRSLRSAAPVARTYPGPLMPAAIFHDRTNKNHYAAFYS